MELKGKRVVLIGGAGFIGHHLAVHLKEQGADVSIIDGLHINSLLYYTSHINKDAPERSQAYVDLINQRIAILREQEIDLYVQDARDYHALSKLFTELKPQVVVQLAAVSHANRSNKDPYTTFDHSLRTLENALDVSKAVGIEHFVYFSSSMVYGNFKAGVVDESTPCEPIGIYGALKYGGEKLVIAYNQVFDLPYTIVRPSALYGERCVSRRVGQIFVESAMSQKQIFINGDGNERLDFTYIQDLVHGIERVITSKGAQNQTFNLTYGESRSLNDMADVIQDMFPGVTVTYKERDRLMPERGTLSVDKAKDLIGYNPSWALEKGYRRYVQWYQDNGLN